LWSGGIWAGTSIVIGAPLCNDYRLWWVRGKKTKAESVAIHKRAHQEAGGGGSRKPPLGVTREKQGQSIEKVRQRCPPKRKKTSRREEMQMERGKGW